MPLRVLTRNNTMKALFKRFVHCSMAMVAITVLLTSAAPAYAQRDAGAKARGEFGAGFWNPKNQTRPLTPSVVATQRSYSYEPTAAVAGCHCDSSHAVSAECTASQPQIVRRSFSYEPSRQGRAVAISVETLPCIS